MTQEGATSMGTTPDSRLDETPFAVTDATPSVRPWRHRQFRPGPDGPVPYLEADDPRHGSANGYDNFRCRCKPCKRAHADSMAAYVARRRAKDKANAA